MNIAYLVPGNGLTAAERTRRQRLLQDAAGEGLRISLLEVDEGPAAIETAADEASAVAPTVAVAREHSDRFDAFIIGCFGDVGIHRLRRAVDIPVIGPARTTYATAGSLYPRFGILALNSGFIEEERELARQLGVSDRVTAVEALDQGVEAIIAAPAATLLRIEEKVAAMAVPAVVPGCMSIAFLLTEQGIDRIAGAHVVNPLICAVRATVALIA